jgi:hypothetical protein
MVRKKTPEEYSKNDKRKSNPPKTRNHITQNGGRKHYAFDWDRIDEMLSCGATGMQVSAMLGCHEDTLYGRVKEEKGEYFSDYAAKRRAKGAFILQEHQYRKAIGQTKEGDNTMLVWVGKQLAGQRENPTTNDEVPEMQKKFLDALKKHCEEDEKPSETEE